MVRILSFSVFICTEALWQGIDDYDMAPEFEDVWTENGTLGR